MRLASISPRSVLLPLKAIPISLRLAAISLLLMMTAGACKKNNASNVASAGDLFPDKVGDYWHYHVIDTTESFTDSTVAQYDADVNIVGTTQLPGGITATIWQFRSPGSTDSNLVFQSGDTVIFRDRLDDYSPQRQYIVPFAIGSSWQYIPGYSDVSVVDTESIDAGGNHFEGAWQIRGSSGRPDGIERIDEWLVNRVGIVRRYINPYGELLPVKHIVDWTLISYQLK